MDRRRFYYLVRIQYLGFRYSGWQKQPDRKTLEQMVVKTLNFILPDVKFKVLGASRTDAKVSALDAAFELFVDDVPMANAQNFLQLLNRNLPADIRALEIKEIDEKFNVIKDVKQKEYVYLFSFGEKNHPFAAPFMTNIIDDLNIANMKKATSLFEGTHDFSAYTARLKAGTNTIRTIDCCVIRENKILSANFFPEKSYALHVKGKGFMRYQIRMIMGAMIQLGKGELSLTDIIDSLKPNTLIQLNYVAPGSGLMLNSLEFV
jgi:tRNA pseudouridine38-40 synthase